MNKAVLRRKFNQYLPSPHSITEAKLFHSCKKWSFWSFALTLRLPHRQSLLMAGARPCPACAARRHRKHPPVPGHLHGPIIESKVFQNREAWLF